LKESILQIADGYTTDEKDADFEVDPVSPLTFIESPEYYDDRGEIWPSVKEDMKVIFSGSHYEPKYETVVYIAGIGSGKTSLMQMILVYCTYWLHCLKNPASYFHLQRGDQISFMNMAPSADNASKILFDKVKRAIDRCKVFERMGWKPTPFKREIVFEKKNILLRSGSSSENFPLGSNLFGGVIDEAAFFETKSGEDKCKELYTALNERRFSRFHDQGIIAMVTSGGSESCFVERKFEESESDNSIYAIRRSRYIARPEFKDLPTFELPVTRIKPSGYTETMILHPPVVLKEKYDANLSAALRDIDGIPSTAIQPFFLEWERILQNINRSRSDPCPDSGDNVPESPEQVFRKLPDTYQGTKGIDYYIHIDIGSGDTSSGKCAAGFAMAHRVKNDGAPRACLDLSVRFKTPAGSAVSLSAIRQFIYDLQEQRKFRIGKVTFDRYQSADSVEILRTKGFDSDILSVGYKEYEICRSAMLDGRVDYYDDKNLLREMKSIEDKVTMVVPGLGCRKDETDAAMGALSQALLGTGLAGGKDWHKPKRPIFVPKVAMGQLGRSNISSWRR
jgi:hypothetical protein